MNTPATGALPSDTDIDTDAAHHIMLVSQLPTFMMNDLSRDYMVHNHTHINDPQALARTTALIGIGSEAKVDRKLLSMLPHVKLISVFGVGYDGIDVQAAKERGIMVTHTPMC